MQTAVTDRADVVVVVLWRKGVESEELDEREYP